MSVTPSGEAGPAAARILVVDDERAIVEALVCYLQRIGLEAEGVFGAEEAKERIAADPSVCVLVSDISMPGKTGLDLAAELLAKAEETRALEVIMITGFADTDTAIAAMRAQAFDLVRKPFRFAEIAEVAKRAGPPPWPAAPGPRARPISITAATSPRRSARACCAASPNRSMGFGTRAARSSRASASATICWPSSRTNCDRPSSRSSASRR